MPTISVLSLWLKIAEGGSFMAPQYNRKGYQMYRQGSFHHLKLPDGEYNIWMSDPYNNIRQKDDETRKYLNERIKACRQRADEFQR